MPVAIETLEAFCHWVSGFVDGEGCFGIYCYKQGKNKKFDPGFLSFEFSIQLREDDRNILEQIHRYFQVGSVVFGSRKKDRAKGKMSRDQVKFTCRTIEDLWGVLVPHFERYPLRSKKANDFRIWKQALALQLESIEVRGGKNVPIHLSKEAISLREQIFSLATELRTERNPLLRRGSKTMVFGN